MWITMNYKTKDSFKNNKDTLLFHVAVLQITVSVAWHDRMQTDNSLICCVPFLFFKAV